MHAFQYELCGGVLLAVAITVAALGAEPAPPGGKGAENDLAKLVDGNNRFAVEIYGKLKGKDQNEFLSPYSISSALGMTYAGARGTTADQMAKAMDFELPPNRLHPVFRQLTDDLNASQHGGELLVANALWAQNGYDFRPEYIGLVKSDYKGKVATVDFEKDTEAARRTINQWVEEQTRQKIKNLLKPGIVNAATRLVLTNAIYFKGAWLFPFSKSQTKQEDFTAAGGNKVSVPMMNKKHDFRYFEDDDLQVLEMHYRSGNVSMMILLPRKVDGLSGLEKRLNADLLKEWISKLSTAEVQVSLPKFRVEREYSLADALKSMGMSDAFSPATADFSGMTGRKDLFLSFVVHKTYVKVDEEGTEAAAATAGGMMATAMPMPRQTRIFRADHPFLFLLRDANSGGILFMGRVMNPAEGGGEGGK